MTAIQDLSASRNQAAIAAGSSTAESRGYSLFGSLSNIGEATWRRTYLAIAALFLLNSLWFIWWHRFMPLQDYPDWLYQGFVLSKFIRHMPPPEFSLKTYPIPYSTVSVVLGVLDLGLSPEVSGKILLTLMVLGFIASSIYLLTSLGVSQSPLLYVAILLCFNSFFFWGNCSYHLGLSILFFLSGYLIRKRNDANRVTAAAILIALFFTHFIPYVAALGLVALLSLDAARARGLRAAFASTVVVVPSMLLLVWYVAGRVYSRDLGGGWTWWPNWHTFGGTIVYSVAPFRVFLPFTKAGLPLKAFAALNLLCAAIALGAIAYAFKGVFSSTGVERVIASCAIIFAVAFVASGWMFASGSTGERFPIPAVMFACCWMTSRRLWSVGKPAVVLRLLLIMLVGAQMLWLDTVAARAATRLNSVYAEMRTASDHGSLCTVYQRYFDASWTPSKRSGISRFLPSAAAAIRIPYFIYMEQDVSAPIFPVGLLHYEGSGSYSNLCENVARR